VLYLSGSLIAQETAELPRPPCALRLPCVLRLRGTGVGNSSGSGDGGGVDGVSSSSTTGISRHGTGPMVRRASDSAAHAPRRRVLPSPLAPSSLLWRACVGCP
jgi:hypothetical protein